MDNMHLKNEIKDMIRESLKHNALRKHIRSIVSEEVHRILKEGSSNKDDDKVAIKRKSVMNMLKDDKYSHAYLAYKLWHPKDNKEKDTYRSLFSKKATGKPDNDGIVRSFTDEEITKLYELIRKN